MALIYAAVVAEAYEAAPKFEERATLLDGYKALIKSNNRLLRQVKSKVDVKFTPDDPYNRHREMVDDIVHNKSLKVYSGADEPHPAFSNDENTILRTVHDFFAHANPTLKYRKAGRVPERNDFTYRGELNAYVTHARLAPEEAVPIIFTEVAAQISYYMITGGYAPQKAAILDGFDYYRVGKYTSNVRQERHNELLQSYNENGYIHVNVKGGIELTKDNINWKMLSRRARAKHKKTS